VTSEGIVGASVVLTGLADDRVVSLNTKTGVGGRFAFEKVPPSPGYWLVATHGEIHMRTIYEQRGLNGPGSQIPVASGQQLRDIRVAMLPTGQISGRVIDTMGKAVSDASVLIMRPYYREGGRALTPAKSFVSTNRRGEYQVAGLTPGLYYVRVVINNINCNPVFQRRAGEEMPDVAHLMGLRPSVGCVESEGYPFIYFPGTADEPEARAVDLRAGGRIDSIDVVVSKVHIRRVQGLVVNPETGLTVPSQLLWFRSGALRGSPPLLTIEAVSGSFDVRNMLPGSYTIVALSKDGNPPLKGFLALNVAADDLNGLRIPVTPGFQLKGRVAIPASTGNANDLSKVIVTLRPDAPSTTGLLPSPTWLAPEIQGAVFYSEAGLLPTLEVPPVRSTLNNGALEFRRISPWNYQVEVRQPFEDAYVKSIRLGKVDLLAEGLHVEGPLQGELEIELAAPAGHIEGHVLDGAQKPVNALRVVLMREATRRGGQDLQRTTLTDEAGHFQFEQLSPGDYRVFAWEFAEDGSWLDADFIRLYEDKGVPVHIEQGSRETLEIRPIPPWF
jgi:protocatechuate 3,4-dioxygenase beta subunit